jgi:plastocyanin
VVHRLRVARLAAPAAWLAAVAVLASAARAQDQKVAIGDYHWSNQTIHVDLGQHVTWYWVGPDTMHSVTGISSNDLKTDSDANTNEPEHRVGYSFQVTFSQPGVYQFQCKLHPIVHGEVIVSAIPGNPDDDPEPVPKPNVDLTPPTLDGLRLATHDVPARGGTTLHFSLAQRATLDAEIWRVRRGGRLTFAGWRRWAGHVGFNEVPFANLSGHFRPRQGRYLAYLTATDSANNISPKRTLRFVIAAPRPRRRE